MGQYRWPTPPWSSTKELQYAASLIESDRSPKSLKKYLALLLAPGSSLGGARPKANIVDDHGAIWIAKFPSATDIADKAAWEFLAFELALSAGIDMSPCKLERVSGDSHTFFTKRFDRERGGRVHFSSAMTMTGHTEEELRDKAASYLDLALFIQTYGARVREDLHQLWRRIVFNMCISNTDDHLRNHGFLLTDKGWVLSPAFDINPSLNKLGLQLNVDMNNNALSLDLAKSVGEFFQLNKREMERIVDQVTGSVSVWKTKARKIGISKGEVELLAPAFSAFR